MIEARTQDLGSVAPWGTLAACVAPPPRADRCGQDECRSRGRPQRQPAAAGASDSTAVAAPRRRRAKSNVVAPKCNMVAMRSTVSVAREKLAMTSASEGLAA
ncbi:unnamed protein product [Prorocentrum cordatum]|uniref:Uncharacterized protein n=1 Tax=Prorocentrum cordatum TaxID=2364126 RepID=A0ABN9Y355_9DINO|nr:unnamed protein product [Polarella glacialis]